MRRRFIVSLAMLFLLFSLGYGLSLLLLSKSSAELETLIELHAIEDMRQDLERQIVLAEQALEVSDTVFANNLDQVIATVRGLEGQMNACAGCHHEGRSQILIAEGIELVDRYKVEFSQFVTVIGDKEVRQTKQVAVARVGRQLYDLVRRIRHIATPRLEQHTVAAQTRIDESLVLLGTTLVLTFLLALVLAWWFTRRSTQPIMRLIDTAHRVAEGRLGAQIEHRERGRIALLLDEFNDMSASLETQARVVEERTVEIRRTRDMALVTLARLAESRDDETGRHLRRMVAYCRYLALALQNSPYANRVDETFIEQLESSSPLHDIGKVGIPDDILRKPGKLTDAEFEVMRTHTIIGGNTLRSVIDDFDDHAFLEMAMEIVYCHHEKWDGSGYPRGLVGEEIPLSGRIVALSDAYDCITTKRVYKPAYGHQEAIRRILKDRGRHFDPVVTDAFLTCQADFNAIRKFRRDFEHEADGVVTSAPKILPFQA